MTDTLILVIIVALILLAVGANVLVYQLIHVSKVLRTIQIEISNVHHTFNSKMDKLLTVTGQAEHAKGVIEGRAERSQPQPQPQPHD